MRKRLRGSHWRLGRQWLARHCLALAGKLPVAPRRVDNSGSYNFKKNQGFEPTLLGYQFDMPNGGPLPNLTPSNRKFHFAQQVWKKLPLALTRPLGSWLSASIPG